MLTLKGRTKEVQITPETGMTILDLALKYDVDWGFSCTRGTCARCRCLISEGGQHLSEPSDAELDRLEDEERAQGYRLGCQAEVISSGPIVAKLETYF
jgi:2Fe-2S ferredoxin